MVTAPADPVGGSDARRAARAELRRPGYGHDGRSVLSRVTDWIGRHLDSLFSGAGGGSHALLLVLVIGLAAVIVFAVRAGAPTRRTRRGRDDASDPLAPQPERDHRRLAEQYTREGRRAEALREWLRAAVRTIEQRGVLPVRPGRTGAATAREAGPLLPAAAADLATAMTAFDEVWFGGRAADDADIAAARSAAGAVASARITRTAAITTGPVAPW